MSNYLIQGETLTGIADAIRAKSGSSDEIKVSDFATQIEEIEGGGEEEQPTAVDLSGYDEGVIVETFEDGTTRTSNLEFDSAGNVSKVTADGVETSYSYEFDSEGNVTKISDSNGNATEIIGGDISIGTNIDTVEKIVSLNFSSGNMEVTPNDGEAFSKVSIPKPSTLVAENIVDGVTIAGIEGTHADRELEDKSITLDFSSGDMEVTAEDGKAFSKVSIPKPSTLVAENIADGVTIAGIEGTHADRELEDKSITLNFSGGDMEVTADNGKAFGSVSIPQPETLLPENIANGVDIAGIVGTFAGAKVKFGTVNPTGYNILNVNHGLGVAPDIIVVFFLNAPSAFSSTYNSVCFDFSISSAFAAKTAYPYRYIRYYRKTTAESIYQSYGQDKSQANDLNNTYAFVNNANENSFTMGSSTYRTPTGVIGYWLAIGGLT